MAHGKRVRLPRSAGAPVGAPLSLEGLQRAVHAHLDEEVAHKVVDDLGVPRHGWLRVMLLWQLLCGRGYEVLHCSLEVLAGVLVQLLLSAQTLWVLSSHVVIIL
jgi:hypothetical protein